MEPAGWPLSSNYATPQLCRSVEGVPDSDSLAVTMDTTQSTHLARRLGGALEPVIGAIYFAPEAHAAYEALGFAGSPGADNGVAWPEPAAYATSRGSILGQVEPMVVAAAFAVFKPTQIAASVRHGWTVTDADTIFAVRDSAALAQLERVLGSNPTGADRVDELLGRAILNLTFAGRPLAAGLAERPPAEHRLGAIFRHGDLLREYRGDSHNAAWVAAGLNGTEIGLLTELYWGLPPRSYSRTRAWTDDDFDQAHERLQSQGLLDTAGLLTQAGRDFREGIETATDAQMAPVMATLGDDATELIELIEPWGVAIRAVGGYPASGPHELAEKGSARQKPPQ